MLPLCQNFKVSFKRFASTLSDKNIVDVDLLNKFNSRVQEVFSTREEFLDFYPKAYKAIHPHSYDKFIVSFESDLKEMQGLKICPLYTDCAATATVLDCVSREILFPSPKVMKEEIKSESLDHLQQEMLCNQLKLYMFSLGKGIHWHHFTLIKWPTKDLQPIFKLYQSFMCAYSLKDYMQSSNFKNYNFESLNDLLLKPLVNMVDNEEWDQHTYDCYERITRVSMRDFERRVRFYSGMGVARYRSVQIQDSIE